MGTQGNNSLRHSSWEQPAFSLQRPPMFMGGPHLSQSKDGPPTLQMSKLSLRRTETAHSKGALGQSSRCSAFSLPGMASVLGNSWVSPATSMPSSPYLLLGQKHLAGEELQALAGEVVAQLLQAVDPQCLGGRVGSEVGTHTRWGHRAAGRGASTQAWFPSSPSHSCPHSPQH